jgi:hypothetical protein
MAPIGNDPALYRRTSTVCVILNIWASNDNTEGSVGHRNDPALKKTLETVERVVAGLTTQVPVKDLVQMRNLERSQEHELENLRRRLTQIERSRSLRLTRPLRMMANWIRMVCHLLDR